MVYANARRRAFLARCKRDGTHVTGEEISKKMSEWANEFRALEVAQRVPYESRCFAFKMVGLAPEVHHGDDPGPLAGAAAAGLWGLHDDEGPVRYDALKQGPYVIFISIILALVPVIITLVIPIIVIVMAMLVAI